ncbi:alpha/beta-hydrolase [Hysterangium stoloniferum]|nr:alpha/beta-hydrolase [Hysterangium stoloniferum]
MHPYSQTASLTDIQKQAHASEKLFNFRRIAYFASRSKKPLTAENILQNRLVYVFISHIGQYSEISHGSISPRFVFDHLEALSRPKYPLHGYDALLDDTPILVDQFEGTVGQLQGYVAFRPQLGQIVAAISGTANLKQTLMNLKVGFARYPHGGKRIKVHAGFWKMYRGLQASAMQAVKAGLENYGESITEIVVTGHSMGGSLSYFLLLDIMMDTNSSGDIRRLIGQRRLKLRLVVFGAPRVGNKAFAEYWTKCISDYHGGDGDMFQEYSLKTNEDGAHILPPHWMGYRHLTQSPIYLFKGNLYWIPSLYREYGAFLVESTNTLADAVTPMSGSDVVGIDVRHFSWPLGGHNYYFRNMESLQRRMKWLELSSKEEDGWMERYKAKLEKWENKYGILPTDPTL